MIDRVYYFDHIYHLYCLSNFFASLLVSLHKSFYIYFCSWANETAKEKYNSYLTIIKKKIEAGEFPSDEPKDELMEEALLGIRNGEITPQILVLIRTKKITRKTIRDDTVKVVLDVRIYMIPILFS